MPNRTTLWNVYLMVEPSCGYYVLVSKDPVSKPWLRHMQIRTITANAAGRRYVRGNYAAHCAELTPDYEYDGTSPWELARRNPPSRERVAIVIQRPPGERGFTTNLRRRRQRT